MTNIYTFVLTILYYKKTTQKTFFIPLYKFIYIFLKKHVVLSSRFQRGQQSRSLFIYCFLCGGGGGGVGEGWGEG